MAEAVVSPAVRPLDFGYQIPNLTDQMRSASAQTSQAAAPIAEAASNLSRARIEFALQNLNAQKAMELAKWNHSAQIQREQMRDQRMVEVAKLRASTQLDALKQKGALDDIKAKTTYLTSRLGGDPIARKAGETDEDYGARLDSAIKSKMETNISSDTKAMFSIKKQIDGYNKYVSDPRVNQAVQGEYAQAAQNPGVRSQAQNYVNTNFNRWLESVAGENAPAVEEALQRAPAQKDLILQRAGLSGAYNDFVGSATQQASMAYLKAAGSPAAKQFATANDNIKLLQQQLQNISMMPGDSGRMVPKPWLPQVQNGVTDMMAHDAQLEQLHMAAAGNKVLQLASTPTQPTAQPAANGVTVPQNSFASGGILGAARGVVSNPNGIVGTELTGLNEAVNPFAYGPDAYTLGKSALVGPWSGAAAPTADDLAAARAGLMARGGPSPIRQNGIVVPPPVVPGTNGPPVIPQPTNSVMMPSFPQLQPIPPGAAISPLSGAAGINPPASQDNYQNPMDPVLQMMQMRAAYAQ